MAHKEYDPMQHIVENVFRAAEIVGAGAEKTYKHAEPFLVYARGSIVERAVRAVQRRVAKASFNYRRLRYSVK